VFVLLTFPLSTHAIAHPCDAAGAPGRRCRASEGAVQAAAVTFCPTGVSFGLMAILGRSQRSSRPNGATTTSGPTARGARATGWAASP